MFLYSWDDTQSAWGPDRTKAHRFASAPLAVDMAVRCGGPNEGVSTHSATTLSPSQGYSLITAMIRHPSAPGPPHRIFGPTRFHPPLTARTVQLEPRAVYQQVQGLGIATSTAAARPRPFQRRRPAAEGGVVRHTRREAEQADNAADQALGLPEGEVEHRAQRERRQDRQAEYQGWPPRVMRSVAAHASIASSLNQTVRLPR